MGNPQTGDNTGKKPFDSIGVLVKLAVVASWFAALAIVWTLSEAAPETAWGMDRMYGVKRDPRWNKDLIALAQSLTLGLMMVSLLGLGVQTTRDDAERKGFDKSLVGFAGVSIAGLVAFFLVA